VRHAIGNRSAAQAPREAAEARRRGLTSTRRQKLRAAAELLVSSATQVEAGKELGVDQRTIRRWKKKRGFATELARARARQERAALRAQTRAQKRR